MTPPSHAEDDGVTPRLLLVEDDPRFGPLLADVLADVYEVRLCTEPVSAAQAARTGDYDVMVVDRRLPGGDGLELVRDLRSRGTATPILVLTALGAVGDRVGGLDAGANDYLVKPFEFEELFARLRAIRRVYSGEGSFLRIGAWEFYPESRAVYSPYDGRSILTDRENELLRLLAEHPDRTFTREQILRRVFDEHDRPGTVDTYVHYVRRKTDADLITTVRGRGYRLGHP